MTTFRCKVLDADDRWSRRIIEAATRAEAIAVLQREGLLVAEIREKLLLWNLRSSIKRAKINRFFEMLANQLDVGIPLLKALQVIQENEELVHVRRLWSDVIHKVASGKSLSSTLAEFPKHFETAELSMIEAGEEGGFLPLALNRIVMLREWKSSISSRIWGAIAYPCILLLAAAIIVPAILVGIVPRFEPLYESLKQSGRMPWITQWLLTLSGAVKNYSIWGLLLAASGAVAWWTLVPKNKRSVWLEICLRRIPYIGTLVQDWSFSQFCQTLSILLENRVGLISALSIAAKASNSGLLTDLIQQTSNEVVRGKSIVQPLSRAKEIDREIIAMLHVGEQSNTLSSVLAKVAAQLEQRIRKNLDLSIKLIEPLLMMILAIVIGCIVIALVLPIFEGNGLGS